MPVVSHHEMVTPGTLAEALDFLAANVGEGWEPFAGGTDVMVGINYGVESRSRWIDLSRLSAEIAGIGEVNGLVRIGGAATMTALRSSDLLRRACPMIAEAAATIGAVQIQNRATVAGNIVNASPAGDTLPVWLALDAEVELASVRGLRRVPYRKFTTAYRTTVRGPDELLTAVLFRPLEPETRVLFRKVGTRAAQAISKVVFAGLTRTGDDGRFSDVRLAFGSMAPVPVRATGAETAAIGRAPSREAGTKAAARLAADVAPIDDVRSTADYRLRVAGNLVREFLAGALGSAVA